MWFILKIHQHFSWEKGKIKGTVFNEYASMPKSESESRSVVSNSLGPHGLYSPWNSPGPNIGVGSLSLLQGIFATHGTNTGLLHCRQVLYQLSHKRNPRILEWVAYPFSRGCSPPRNQTGVSCIAGGFFNNWASGNLSMPNSLQMSFF